MKADEDVRRHLDSIPADRRAFAEDFVAHAEESGPYAGRFGTTNLVIDMHIYADYMATHQLQ